MTPRRRKRVLRRKDARRQAERLIVDYQCRACGLKITTNARDHEPCCVCGAAYEQLLFVRAYGGV